MREYGLSALGLAALALVPSLAPSLAFASNGMAPRTPPVFVREACLANVDRSVDAIFHLDYGIPFEDNQLTPDELQDSRRFQFFALCEDAVDALRPLPSWTSLADAQRALDAGLIEELPEPSDILGEASVWNDCLTPLNSGDARIPIVCADTEGGLDWNTTQVPAGNYVIRGYTFEPGVNLWTGRRGTVQVRDDDSQLVGVSLTSPAVRDLVAYEETGFRVLGCASGPEGTNVSLQWASLIALGGDDDEAVWSTFAEFDANVGSFDELFDPPVEAINQPVLVRGVATGPSGARWVSYAAGTLLVFAGDEESDDAAPPRALEFCGFYDDDDPTGGTGSSGDSGGETGTDAGTEGGGTDSGGQAGERDEGCGCRAGRGGPAGVLFALALLWWRRRAFGPAAAHVGRNVQK